MRQVWKQCCLLRIPLNHETDMNKSFPSREEALGLTPDQAARQITETPRGQFALYDAKQGEVVKMETARFSISHPGRSNRTRQIRSVMCVRNYPGSG